MSAPFDLSDALKTSPSPLTPGGKGGGERPRGTGTRLDDAARPIVWVAFAACVLLLIYVFGGLFGGTWTDPGWDSIKNPHQLHVFHAQQVANIALVFRLLRLAVIVMVAALIVCCLQDEGIGYVLLGAAAVFYFGLPLLSDQVFAGSYQRGTLATEDVLRGFQSVALILGVPGLIWTGVDIVRRFRAAADAAAIQRANQKFAEQSKARSLGVTNVPRKLTVFERQNRNYQYMAVALLVVEPTLVFLNLGTIQDWVTKLLSTVESITTHLSFSADPRGISQLHNDDSGIILWTMLIALNLIVLSQALRLLEYLCFKRKG